MSLLEVIAVVSSLSIIAAVVLLIRGGRLLERYAILWLVASGVLLVFSIWRSLLDTVADALGFYYAPSFLFLAGFVFLLLILLHFSVVISSLSNKNKSLARHIGMLKREVEELKGEAAASVDPPAEK
jgi:hypothetical protein